MSDTHASGRTRLDADENLDPMRAKVADMLKEHLAAGVPISYRDPAFNNRLIKEYPDGRKVFIEQGPNGELIEQLITAPKAA
jgi:hypothetical protein